MSDDRRTWFGAYLARLRRATDRSQRQLAERLCALSGLDSVTRHEISRWERGARVPDAWLPVLAQVLGVAVGELERAAAYARGETDTAPGGPSASLAGLLPPDDPPGAERDSGVDGDIAHMRASVSHLLAHDNRYGSTAVAPAAVQVWRAEQRKLDRGAVPDRARAGYLSAVAELAEIAGWLLFDSRQWDASRTAFLESHLLARQAGDRTMEWFALDMLAMHDVQTGRAGEALRIADELLTGLRVPPRIALLARVRRGRALAQVGDHRRALTALEGARAGLEDSISPRDPAWAWWVNDTEITGHEGEALLAAGEAGAAIPKLQRALELASAHFPAGRGALYYSVALLSAYARTHAWRECEATLASINTLLETVTSERSRDRLRTTLRAMARQPEAPPALLDLAQHTSEVS